MFWVAIESGFGVGSFRLGERRFAYETDADVSFVTAVDGRLYVATNADGERGELAELIALP